MYSDRSRTSVKMPQPKNQITLITRSTDTDCDSLDFSAAERKQADQNIKVRRRAVLLAIVTIFSVTAILIGMSVVHAEMNKRQVGYQELICHEKDLDCFKLLCPQDWRWVKEKEQCSILEGN